MRFIIKLKWAVLGIWLAIALGLTFYGPDLQQLVAEKGQITVPEGNPSVEADHILQKMNESSLHLYDGVLAFHKNEQLTEADISEIEQAIQQLKNQQADLHLSNILDFTEAEEIEESTVAKDGKTIIVPFEVSMEHQSVNEAREAIYEAVENISVPHHITGGIFIEEDIIINSEEGLTKTIYITVALILIILFLVFRSFVAPIIPLLTVGISFLVAQGIVAILADTVNFPLSTFTQIFMVAVMFGIGTDYCILIISRFKEEINEHHSIRDAIISTYKATGKTVFFAALAVLIGFSTIGLSSFSLYQSAVAVAVGVAITLIAIITLVPFFLSVLGKKLFWPFDKNVEHKESGLWKKIGEFSWARPAIALLIIAVVTVPALLTYDGDQSYDSLAELNDSFGSVKAFNWIANSFGPGEILPTTVVMEVDEPIDSVEDYQAIEKITGEIAELEGVDRVRSATRPTGDIIEDFLLESQTDLLTDGLSESVNGLNEIESGLREAAAEMSEQSPQLDEAKDGVQALMDGTNEANDGIGQMQQDCSEIEQGITNGSAGAGEVKSGLETIQTHLNETIEGNKQILTGYEQLADRLKGFGSLENGNENDLKQLRQLVEGIEQSIDGMYFIAKSENPESSSLEEPYGQSKELLNYLLAAIDEIEKELGKLANAGKQVEQLISAFNELNENFAQTIYGQEQLSDGLSELIAGVSELESGLKQAGDGQDQVVSNFPTVRDGLVQIYGGQKELKSVFSELQNGFNELSDGLIEGSDGLDQIDEGLTTIQDYLGDVSLDSSSPVVVIPEEALDEEDFLDAAEIYLSDDHKTVKFEVILSDHPYSHEAIQLLDEIKHTTDLALKETPFEDSIPYIAGTTSTNNDLKNVSDEDYSRTALLMIIGIFIMLVILLRSLIMPIYLLGSLLLTYFTALSFSEIIFVNMLGHDGLSWVIPFFSFVMLIALGVDYSIFLMGRFNEYKNGVIKEAMMRAMRNMGTVIISATIILAGTFGAMLPAGVLSLLQIATVVIIGLVLYAFLILPFFTPVAVKLFGKFNWWPFRHQMKD